MEKKEQNYKDGSGLQFINFDFVTGDQEIKVLFLRNYEFSSRYFVFLVHISLRLSIFGDFIIFIFQEIYLFIFQEIKVLFLRNFEFSRRYLSS